MAEFVYRYLPVGAWWIAVIIILGLALRAGGRDEKAAAVAISLASFATLLAVLINPGWQHAKWMTFVVDLILLFALLRIAMRTAKFWPLFAAAFHMIDVTTHIAAAVLGRLGPMGYAMNVAIWSYLTLGAVLIGSVNEMTSTRHSRR